MTELLALPTPPDAVFCYNDLMALGALRTMNQLGVRVPDDIALMGFDDIEEGRYSTPTLSTVRPDKAAIAQAAVDLLARRLDAETTAPPREVRVPFEIVPRQTTDRD